jgi:hypothetical protein
MTNRADRADIKLRLGAMAMATVLAGGCGAIPANCPNGEVTAREALLTTVVRAAGPYDPGLDMASAEQLLATHPAGCCSAREANRSLGERAFELPSARSRYEVIVNLDLAGKDYPVDIYAETLVNPCGEIIHYRGFASRARRGDQSGAR